MTFWSKIIKGNAKSIYNKALRLHWWEEMAVEVSQTSRNTDDGYIFIGAQISDLTQMQYFVDKIEPDLLIRSVNVISR